MKKYNAIKFKGKVRQFFRKKSFKPGQVVTIKNGEPMKLIEFIKYNNVFTECWLVEFVNHPEMGQFEHFMSGHISINDGEYQIITGMEGW